MKNLILSLSILAATTANAFTPQQVSQECVKQMAVGICMAIPDRSAVTPGQQMLIAGVGRVNYSAYLDYMDKYNPAMPSDPAMCDLALTKMTAEPGSDHDKVARALWQPVPEPEPATITVPVSVPVSAAVAAGVALFAYRRRAKAIKP